MPKPNPGAALDRALADDTMFTRAVKAGISRSYLYDLRNGLRTPGLAFALLIEEALGIPAEHWLTDEERRLIAQVRAAKGAENVRA